MYIGLEKVEVEKEKNNKKQYRKNWDGLTSKTTLWENNYTIGFQVSQVSVNTDMNLFSSEPLNSNVTLHDV